MLATALLVLAAAVGGVLNSVVGGGTFVVFPALLLAGVPAIAANATAAFVLWPAALASAVAYRREVGRAKRWIPWLGAASLIGGALGAEWLLVTPGATFGRAVPWLLLVATLLFTFGGRLHIRGDAPGEGDRPTSGRLGATALAQTGIAVYGGYFGGGMGILMLGAWSLAGMRRLHTMNGLRTLLSVIINGAAVASFIAAGAVAWRPGLPMVAAASLAGYLGAASARRVEMRTVRRLVLVIAWGMTVYFFVRYPAVR